MCLSIGKFVEWFIYDHYLISSCMHLFRLLIHLFIYLFTSNQSIHSFIHSLTHSFIHSFIHSLTHSFIHSLTHSFIHSFICQSVYLSIYLSIYNIVIHLLLLILISEPQNKKPQSHDTACEDIYSLVQCNFRSEKRVASSRVVDLSLNQADKPWFHQYSDPDRYHLWLCLFSENVEGTNLQPCQTGMYPKPCRHGINYHSLNRWWLSDFWLPSTVSSLPKKSRKTSKATCRLVSYSFPQPSEIWLSASCPGRRWP